MKYMCVDSAVTTSMKGVGRREAPDIVRSVADFASYIMYITS